MTSNPVKEEAVTPRPSRIYLQPDCCVSPCEGRQWCEDNVWPIDEAECDKPGIEYVRADLAMRQADPRIAELEAALRHVRPLLVLRSGIPREERGQAIERIDAALNRKDKP